MLTQCVHCNGVVSNRDYWYFTERLPIHTGCVGYLDEELLTKLFPDHIIAFPPRPITVDSV